MVPARQRGQPDKLPSGRKSCSTPSSDFATGPPPGRARRQRKSPAAAGTCPETVHRAFVKLLEAGLIADVPIPSGSEAPWLTHVLCHWRAWKNQCTKQCTSHSEQVPPPYYKLRAPLLQDVAPPYTNWGGGHMFERFIEESSSTSCSPETDDDASSSSTQEESKTPPSTCTRVADLVARVRATWPDEPDLDHRVAELVELAGDEAQGRPGGRVCSRAAGEAVRLRVVLVKSWYNLTAVECRGAGHGAGAPNGPRRRLRLPPAHVAAKPPSQDVDPVFADLMHQFNRAEAPERPRSPP